MSRNITVNTITAEQIHVDFWQDDMEVQASIDDYVLVSVTGIIDEDEARNALVVALGEVGRILEIKLHNAPGGTGA